jgi:hypothetical protein
MENCNILKITVPFRAKLLLASAVECGFEPRSGQTKNIKLVFVAFPLNVQHLEERAKTG